MVEEKKRNTSFVPSRGIERGGGDIFRASHSLRLGSQLPSFSPPSIDLHSPKSPQKLFLFQLVQTCEGGRCNQDDQQTGSIETDGFILIPLRTAAESSSLLSTCGGGCDDHGIKDQDLTVLVSPRKFTQACSRFEQLASPPLSICNADSIFA